MTLRLAPNDMIAARTTAHPLRVGVSFYLEDIVPAVAAYAVSTQDVQLWVSRMYEPHDARGSPRL